MNLQICKFYIEKAIENICNENHAEISQVSMIIEGVLRETGEFVLRLIKEKYQSYEKYFEKEFGLSLEQLKQLRDIYLEKM